jgi:hypothetical protein
MKLLKVFISATVLALTVTNAQAMPDAAPTQKLDSSQNIFVIHFKSKTSHYFAGFTEYYYTGISPSAPCSDLAPYTNFSFTGIYNWDHEFDSGAIIAYFGPRLTCLKEDLVWDNKRYSTGNVQVMWDEKAYAYVAATPSEATFDFDTDGTPAS